MNLPFTGQLVGALASRSTHPNFIRLFNDLITAVLPSPLRVENPLLLRTRAEVLGILAEARCAELLQETNSCSRGRGRPLATPHCGFCSQCVDRRFGAIAAGLEEHDLAERYGLDVFTQPLPAGEPRTIAESYVRFARELHATADEQLFDAYPQLYDCLDPADPAPQEIACQLTALLKRHAASALDVVARMVARYRHELAADLMPEDSLLRLVIGGGAKVAAQDTEEINSFLHEGATWALTYRRFTARVRHGVGLEYLAGLLRHPGQEFHVLDMSQGHWVPRRARDRASRDGAHLRQLAASDLRVTDARGEDSLLDEQARAEYQERLRWLRDQVRQAEARHDPEHGAQYRCCWESPLAGE